MVRDRDRDREHTSSSLCLYCHQYSVGVYTLTSLIPPPLITVVLLNFHLLDTSKWGLNFSMTGAPLVFLAWRTRAALQGSTQMTLKGFLVTFSSLKFNAQHPERGEVCVAHSVQRLSLCWLPPEQGGPAGKAEETCSQHDRQEQRDRPCWARPSDPLLQPPHIMSARMHVTPP